MKRSFLKYSLYSLIVMVMASCGDEVDPSIITDFQPITSAESADAFLEAVYDLMRDRTLFEDAFVIMPILFSDQAQYASTIDPDWVEASNLELEPGNETLDDIYTQLYNINANISVLLAELDTSIDVSLTPDIIAGFEAEGRAIRGFIYYYLNQLWGNVPLVLDEGIITDSLLENSTGTELYTQMVEDLEFARDNISLNGFIDGDQGRLDEAAIKTLLARVHLVFGENQLAFDAAEDVFDLGLSLEPDVNDVYNNLNSQENLWRLTENSVNTSLGKYFAQPFTNGQYVVRPRAAVPFETNDARRDAALSLPGTTIRKYNDVLNNSDPVYFVRLAEAYLIAAESAARLGNYDDASDYLNIVRNRAGLGDVTLEINNWEALILQERHAELCYEGLHRLSDLRRFGEDFVALEVYGYDDPKDDLWPYSDRILEDFVSLEQNPEY